MSSKSWGLTMYGDHNNVYTIVSVALLSLTLSPPPPPTLWGTEVGGGGATRSFNLPFPWANKDKNGEGGGRNSRIFWASCMCIRRKTFSVVAREEDFPKKLQGKNQVGSFWTKSKLKCSSIARTVCNGVRLTRQSVTKKLALLPAAKHCASCSSCCVCVGGEQFDVNLRLSYVISFSHS